MASSGRTESPGSGSDEEAGAGPGAKAAFIDPKTVPYKPAEIQKILDDIAPRSPPWEGIGDPAAPDILTRLGRQMALASQVSGQEDLIINLEGDVTRAWILGAQKVMTYEREAHWEQIVGTLMDRVVIGNAEMLARQEKVLDTMGLMAVMLSMVTTRGCMFCDDEWELRKTKGITGPELMRHFVEEHFNAGKDADVDDITDEQLMEIDADEMPGEFLLHVLFVGAC